MATPFDEIDDEDPITRRRDSNQFGKGFADELGRGFARLIIGLVVAIILAIAVYFVWQATKEKPKSQSQFRANERQSFTALHNFG